MALHPRNERYKKMVLAAPYALCLERARFFTESYRRTAGEHPAMRLARAFDHTVRHMTVYILDEERIVGNRSSKLVATVLPIERGDINTILEYELDLLTARQSQPYKISAAEKRELRRDILPFWRGKTLRDRKKELWDANGLTEHATLYSPLLLKHLRHVDVAALRPQADIPWSYRLRLPRLLRELDYNNPFAVANCFDVQGHLIVGHRNILREGWLGVRRRAEAKLAELPAADVDGRAFLQAVIVCAEAIRDLGGRFADLAERTARATNDPARRDELLAVAARCAHVPYHPLRDFREAVQALWLNQVGALIAYGMAGIFAVGRLDQYLAPYFLADQRAGNIADDEAVELLEELLIKFSYNLLTIPAFGKQTGSELGSDSNAPTVGGVGPDGADATNELSYLTLTAYANVKSLGNTFSIRLSSKSPPEWWRSALATYRRTSGAALLNDDLVVPALAACGYDLTAARDYGVVGCVEPTGDGDTFGCTSGNDVSLVAPLEMTLLNGSLRIMGRRIGPQTGDPRAFRNFAQFLTAYKTQLRFLIDTLAKAVNLKDLAYREGFPNPYVSATLTGCVEHARDMTAGGARYNFASLSGRGLGTAVDSLAAIEHFVFREHSMTMDELLALLDDNFAGTEVVRARLANQAPRYGAGDARADALAAEVVAFFCGEVRKHKTIRGGVFRPGFFSYGMHVLDGILLGATPDGRRVGEPVSNSFSPANGAEKRGLTALLSSVAAVDHTAVANGLAVNVKLSPALFRDDEHLDKMTALIKTYFAQGGMELSPNVISSATLRKAQAHPDEFRDLVVRVSGYAAYFCDLGTALQDEIIARTEFGGREEP
ncbi:MAG TPA: pyruvate formate lyase family protein [bacterium]|nr:pyruvate formate lyase family protein [bacterium]